MAIIRELVDQELSAGRRTLIAIDLSLGFVAGTAHILGLNQKPAWRATWRELERRITDSDKNLNNRIAVANDLNRASGIRLFWGRPASSSFDQYQFVPIRNIAVDSLAPNPLPRLRVSERLATTGMQSNWQLVGQGAVGGQVLTGLAHLSTFERNYDDAIAVWPFCGLGDPGTPVVLVETWHSLFPFEHLRASCRDEAQVRGTAEALRANRDQLDTWFAPPSLLVLSKREQRSVINEEGWTFGVL